MRRILGFSLLPFCLLAALARGFTPTEDGLYAVFQTNRGEFTAELFFEDVPLTVGNFVGLAEGSLASRDLRTGQARFTPYYAGIIFHRVVAGFVIQAGSPNGQGTDGPGYTIIDEIRGNRLHTAAGVLSMAKAAAPNSGGSQFFVTLAATSHLDGNHAIFGRIVEGMDNVHHIGTTPTGANGRPQTDVVIESLTIVRVGAAAQAFDPRAQLLPQVTEVPLAWTEAANALTFQRQADHQYFFHGTANLVNWSEIQSYPRGASGPTVFALPSAANTAGRYFVGSSSLRAPAWPAGNTSELDINLGNSGNLQITFNADGRGTYIYNGNPGTLESATFFPMGPTTQVLTTFSGLLPMQIHLQDGQATSGTVVVRVLASYGSPPGNDFTLTGTYTRVFRD